MINENRIVAGKKLSIKMDRYFLNLWTMRAHDIYVCSAGYMNIGLVTASQSIRIEALVAVSLGIHRAWQISVVALFGVMGIMVPYIDKDTSILNKSQILMGMLYSLQYISKKIPVGLIVSLGLAAVTAAAGIKNLVDKGRRDAFDSLRFFDVLPVIAGLANAAPMAVRLFDKEGLDKFTAIKKADFFMNPLAGIFSIDKDSGGLKGWVHRIAGVAKIPLTILGPSVRQVTIGSAPDLIVTGMNIKSSVFMADNAAAISISNQIFAYRALYGGMNIAGSLSITAADAHVDAGITIADSGRLDFPNMHDHISPHHQFFVYDPSLHDPTMTADQIQEFLNGMHGQMHYTNMATSTDMKVKDSNFNVPKGHHGTVDAAGFRFTAGGTAHERHLADEAKEREDAAAKKYAAEHPDEKKDDTSTANHEKTDAEIKAEAELKAAKEAKGQAGQEKAKEPPKLTEEEAKAQWDKIHAPETTLTDPHPIPEDGQTGTLNYSTHHVSGDPESGLILVESGATVYSGDGLNFNAATTFAMYKDSLLKGGKPGAHVFAQLYAYCYGGVLRSQGLNVFAGHEGTLMKDVAVHHHTDTGDHPGKKSKWGDLKNRLKDKIKRKIDDWWDVTAAKMIGAGAVVGDPHSDTVIQAAQIAAGNVLLQGHVLETPPEDLPYYHKSRGISHGGYGSSSSEGNTLTPTTVISDDLTLKAQYADIYDAKIQTDHLHLMIKNQLAATMVLTWYSSTSTRISASPKAMVKSLISQIKHLPRDFIRNLPVLGQMAKTAQATDNHERLATLWNAGTQIPELGQILHSGNLASLVAGTSVGAEAVGLTKTHVEGFGVDGAQIDAGTTDGHVGSMHMEATHFHTGDASGLTVDKDIDMVDGVEGHQSSQAHVGVGVSVGLGGVGVSAMATLAHASSMHAVKSEFSEGNDHHAPSAKVGGKVIHQAGPAVYDKSSTRGMAAGSGGATLINQTQDYDASVALPSSLVKALLPAHEKPSEARPTEVVGKVDELAVDSHQGMIEPLLLDGASALAEPDVGIVASASMPELSTSAYMERYLLGKEPELVEHIISHFVHHTLIGTTDARVVGEILDAFKETIDHFKLIEIAKGLTINEADVLKQIVSEIKTIVDPSMDKFSLAAQVELKSVMSKMDMLTTFSGSSADEFHQLLHDFTHEFQEVFSEKGLASEIKSVKFSAIISSALMAYELYQAPPGERLKVFEHLLMEISGSHVGAVGLVAVSAALAELTVPAIIVIGFIGGVAGGTVTHNLIKDIEKHPLSLQPDIEAPVINPSEKGSLLGFHHVWKLCDPTQLATPQATLFWGAPDMLVDEASRPKHD